jgi:hypothetical protein
MTKLADIVVNDLTGRTQLVVEIKTTIGASALWAAELRRNLLAHAVVPNAPFFLLALPDKFYLWTDSDTTLEPDLPAYQVDARQVLAPHLQNARFSLDDISEYSLELLVVSWLQDVIHADTSENGISPDLEWLYTSGLLHAIKDGSVLTEVSA